VDRLFLWLWRSLRPREGWLLLSLALALVWLLPASIQAAAWTRRADSLWGLALWAVLSGRWLSGRRWRASFSLLSGGLLGVALVANAVGQLLPSFGQLLWEIARSLAWSWQRWQGAPFPRDLWLPLFNETVWRTQGFALSLGSADGSIVIFRLILAALVWTTGAWLGFWLLRPTGARPWAALWPAGLALTVNAFYADKQAVYVAGFLALTLAVLAATHWQAQARAWAQRASDYSDGLVFDHGVAAALILALALTAAALTPPIALRTVQYAFWDWARAPWQALEARVRATFPGVIRPARSPLVAAAPSSGLPRQELLGSGPELAKQELFRIAIDYYRTDHWSPYWKEATFALYTGRGWALETPERLTVLNLPAGQPWRTAPADAQPAELGVADAISVRQTIEWVGEEGQVALAAGEVEQASAAYRAILRQPGDLVGIELEVPQRRVVVNSHIPLADAEKLRIANIPIEKKLQPYRKIPESVPVRVINLARTVTSGAATPYDQALQIEAYLRTLTYDLNVPRVAPTRDLVDAFLFDLRRGYCDYFASAFVVMARSVGLPARLAVGYASGRQEAPGLWVVSAADAHSWPEVYLAGVGWTPFEPTPSRPRQTPLSAPPLATPVEVSRQPTFSMPAVGSALAALSLLLLSAWLLRRENQSPSSVTEMSERLVQWGTRVGYRPRPGATLREFDQGLDAHLTQLAARRSATDLAEVRRVLHRVSQACEAGLYGGPEAALSAAQVAALWRRWRGAWWVRWRLTRFHG